MRILSLDTTTRDGSAAIVEDDRVVDVRRGDGSRSHAERLPGELIALVDAHGFSFRDVDVFAVASGPGSFTGLRIGIATVQGLAFTCGRRVVALPALDALAHAASLLNEPGTPKPLPGTGNQQPGTRLIVSWMDAHRREVFGAAYRIVDAPPFEPERLSVVNAASVGPPSAMLEGLRAIEAAAPIVFAGDGALMYGEEIARVFPTAEIRPSAPIAGVIGLMAVARARRGDTIDPAAIQPLYVRRPDAEVAREARG
ncbi:MAG TPA: tRNA (adenosine(37)-N6)-threonylcarbamoyltransferase complex dimerization subunit type 1 TsaB [Vicinamibacterales bacterium]|nr:tRNA (adenosine(37)-N6)-threonylcarbamoyltransferase complex dimerization subunit type 1 TsaB [Vicinamibacterales bacterium]